MSGQRIDVEWRTIAGYRVVYWTYKQGWTWDSYAQARERTASLIEDEPKPTIPLIFDVRAAQDVPPGMIRKVHNIAVNRIERLQPIIIMGAGKIMSSTVNIIKRMVGKEASAIQEIQFVKDVDELEYLIRTHVLE